MITYYCIVGKPPHGDWVVVYAGGDACGKDDGGHYRAIYTCPVLALKKMLLWQQGWNDTEYKLIEISESEL